MTNMIEGPFDAERVRVLREVLTATGAGIYLATHQAGPLPAEALAAARESDDMDLRVGRVGPGREDDLAQRDREARAVLAAAMHASPDRLALAHGSAEAARLVALEALAVGAAGGPGGAIVVAGRAGVAAALGGVARALGAPFRAVDDIGALGAALDGPTTLVAWSHADADGTVGDVAAVVAAARRAGARTLLDASLTCGAIPIEVDALDVDAVIADAHHWLLGPQATALVWLGPSFGTDAPTLMRSAAAALPRGTLIALARSVGWLLMYAELPWVLARTRSLVARVMADLEAIAGVEVLTDPSAHAAIVSLRIEGWTAEQAGHELSRSVFAVLEAEPERDVIRIGVGAWNREDELRRLVERIAELAAHTPETLPRRPSLTVLSGPPSAPG